MRLLWLLFARAAYEWQGGFEGDGHIYMAVGRGILNGLLPYKDLFETKPPGMFVISALSLHWFNSIALGNVLQAVVTLGLAAVTTAGIWVICRPQWKDAHGKITILASIGAGAFIGLYASIRSGGFQTESFGAFFVALYLLILIVAEKRQSWLLPFLGGISVMIAAGLKEPFVLGAAGGAVLLLSGWKNWLRLFVFPLAVAGICGLLLLYVTGWWQPYIDIYLGHMFGSHLSIFGPTWVRALFIEKTWSDLLNFSRPLGFVFAALFLSAWWMSANAAESMRSKIAFFLSASIAAITFFLTRSIVFSLFAAGKPESQALLTALGILAVGFALLGAVNIGFVGKEEGQKNIGVAARFLLFFYLLLQINGIGGDFVGHQFGFSTPFYIALFLVWTRQLHSRTHEKRGWLFAVGCLALVTVFLPIRQDGAQLNDFLKGETILRTEAASFDAMLTACTIDRYTIVGEVPVDLWAYTTHSPMGPAFFQYALNYPLTWIKPDSFFIDSHLYNVEKALVVVVPEKNGRPIPDEIVSYIQTHFTQTPPSCAGTYKNPPGSIVLFRNS